MELFSAVEVDRKEIKNRPSVRRAVFLFSTNQLLQNDRLGKRLALGNQSNEIIPFR
jgi:hypothetical protein